jgi:hypothetical protein
MGWFEKKEVPKQEEETFFPLREKNYHVYMKDGSIINFDISGNAQKKIVEGDLDWESSCLLSYCTDSLKYIIPLREVAYIMISDHPENETK